MRHWTGRNARFGEGVPEAVRGAATALDAKFWRILNDGRPRLLSIGAYVDDDDDIHQHEVVVELAPGVTLPVECGLVESVLEYGDEPCTAEDIVEWTMEGVEACMPKIDVLSDALHDARRRARNVIGSWARDGIQSRLVDARLAPYDAWRGSADPAIRLLVESLNERLQPATAEIQLGCAPMLENALHEFRSELALQLAARAELASHGASGTIDQLALNAIAQHGDVAATLRRFDAEWRFWLPDATALIIRDGEVTAGNGDVNPVLHLGRGSVTISGVQVPETSLVAATGRPATDIVVHPFLSADMTVREASSSFVDGTPAVTLRLDVPRWFFCVATGRTWRVDVGDGQMREPTEVGFTTRRRLSRRGRPDRRAAMTAVTGR